MKPRYKMCAALITIAISFLLDPYAYVFLRALLNYENWGEMREMLMTAKFLGSGLGIFVIGITVGFVDRSAMGWKRARALWLIFILTGTASIAIKVVSGRERPSHEDQDPGQERFAFCGPSYGLDAPFQSFPSGHTTTSFAVATGLAQFYPPARVVFFVAAGFTGVNRVVKHQHFLSDVVVGALLGHLMALWFLRRKSLGSSPREKIDSGNKGP